MVKQLLQSCSKSRMPWIWHVSIQTCMHEGDFLLHPTFCASHMHRSFSQLFTPLFLLIRPRRDSARCHGTAPALPGWFLERCQRHHCRHQGCHRANPTTAAFGQAHSLEDFHHYLFSDNLNSPGYQAFAHHLIFKFSFFDYEVFVVFVVVVAVRGACFFFFSLCGYCYLFGSIE